jgi:hypothetical protein
MPCCPVCGNDLPQDRKDQHYCSMACYRNSAEGNRKKDDPTPNEIIQRSELIRGGWSDLTKNHRLRVDWRSGQVKTMVTPFCRETVQEPIDREEE